MTITTVLDVTDPALVGHKFARLHRMRAAGFPVPDLIAVPATAFDDAFATVELGDGPDRWERAAAALRAAPVPQEILDQVTDRFGPDTVFAVRACAVASTVDGSDGEDGTDPFAGMSDSFLYVPADRVADRIAACWASAFTARAVAYREFRGLDPARTRIAVGVQLMVPGTRSFVVFTRDPRDGARRTVIAAAHGIGEGVVQEKADVDHFHVTGTTVTADLVRKERMVGPPPAGSDELALLPVPAGLAAAPVLDDRTARAVAALAARVEVFFGGPQDVEGTITADGVLHLVQARPMVLPAGPPLYWANHNITESYPGVSGALTFSQAQEFYRRAFGDMYHRMGVPARTVDANRHHLEQLVAHLDGRVYYRLAAWHALHGQMPVFDLVRDVWQDGMGVTGEARPPVTRSRRRAWLALPGTVLRATRHPRRAREFLRWWDGVMTDAGDLSGRTPHQLVDEYRRLWAAVSVRWGVTLTNSIYGLLAVKALMRLLDRWAGGKGMLTGLLTGGPANRSLQAVRASVALAELVAADPDLRAAVESGERPREVWRDISAGRHGAALAEAAADYLRRYGDRALHDLKLEQPTPRQQPWTVLELLRPYITQGRTVEALLETEQQAARQAAEELSTRCPGRLRRAVVRGLARYVRYIARVREDTRFCRTQLYGLSREILWRLGSDLHTTGHLDDPLDIRDLTVAEVLGAYDGTLPCAALRDLAAARRRERLLTETRPNRAGLLRTPATGPLADTLPDAVEVTAAPAVDAAGVLTGLGSAPGVVRAPARLVLDPSVAPETCRDAILVARETDPGWLFLMMAAKGLVVERGTLLSHTAITGRLLGVPTVVAVHGATTRIPDGALIELDGTAGTVRILPEQA
ncbi:PEP/pyruvate-binding domain-containing protein [Dactylosporangium sp. NPDC049525]|uniref:PEP/pyruvate-binding domain-containing protein n=1 Tax=Dactylosporangium sp. NPDC049525 TaxID=3154730 RepID=UPI003444A757